MIPLGVLASAHVPAAGGTFSPLDIGWHSLLWAEDPDVTPPSDGALVGAWNNPGTSGVDWGNAGNSARDATYRASDAAFGQPAFEFIGVQFFEQVSTFTAVSSPFTIAAIVAARSGSQIICQNPSSTSVGRLERHSSAPDDWAIRNTTFRNFGSADSNPHAIIAVFNDASSTWRVDDNSGTLSSPGTSSVDQMRVGAALSNDMTLAFFGLYQGVLSAGEINSLVSYSQSHYGTP